MCINVFSCYRMCSLTIECVLFQVYRTVALVPKPEMLEILADKGQVRFFLFLFDFSFLFLFFFCTRDCMCIGCVLLWRFSPLSFVFFLFSVKETVYRMCSLTIECVLLQ